jgi:glycosyltransferase involved in cell wall biosynthesis
MSENHEPSLKSNHNVNICFINKFNWLGAAPMGTVSVMMCHALATAGCKVTLYISGEHDPNPQQTLKTKYGMDPLDNFHLQVFPKSLIKKFSKFAFNLYIRVLIHILQNRNKSERLIIISRNTNFLPFMWILKKLTGASVYFESHSFHNRARGERKCLNIAPDFKALQPWLLEKLILSRLDGLICMAKSQKRLYNAIMPSLPSIVLPLGSPDPSPDAEKFFKNRDPRKLMYCGRYTVHIDVDTLIRALSICKSANVTLTWYGLSAEEKTRLLSLASQYNIQDAVQAEGWLSHRELEKKMVEEFGIGLATYKKDYLTSRLASPTKIFDYYSAGLPVIASKINTVSDVLTDGEEGLLYKAGDSESLAQCILRMINEPALYLKLQENSFKSAAFYSWKNRAQRFIVFSNESNIKAQ